MPQASKTGFSDRRKAGKELATALRAYAGRSDVIVLALPRGGVPVAVEVAEELGVALDLFLVRKLGVPNHPELAMGAIASGGVRVINDDVVRWYGVSPAQIETIAAEEQLELERREAAYREGRPGLPIEGRVVILIDDGLATASSMRASVKAIRLHNPARIIVAVPVGARETCDELSAHADEVVCVRSPEPFVAVGQWYGDFSQTSDQEVRDLLRGHALPSAHQ